MNISTAELLEALAAEASAPERADRLPRTYSGPEIRAKLRCGNDKFSRQMRAWITAGVCTPVRVTITAVDGRQSTPIHYQFAAPVRAKRRAA